MSAIAGIIRTDGRTADRLHLERMVGVLTPYGKDAQHQWQQGPVGLLHTLLRTTPEDSLDHQPLLHPASGTTLVFDGRIDNRDELVQELALTKSETVLMADSALVLRACLRWDTQAVDHLLGDFALACWQGPRRRLWLARDALGVRPLYWHQQPGLFAFATMPKALFAVPGIPRALCEERLHDYLCLLPMHGPDSFFKGIYRVEPGQFVVLEGDKVASHRYHRFSADREVVLSSDEDYLEAFREHLDRAVACRLRSSGPIASHLSSGFDSSTITAVAASQLAARGSPLLAYTAVPHKTFKGPVAKGCHADEGPAAHAVAARFPNIEHILIASDGTSPIDHLRETIGTLDRAPLNPCNMVWLGAINADASRRGVKVLLSGGKGNMTISYAGEEYLSALLGRGRLPTWWREVRSLMRRNPDLRWRQLLVHSVAPYLPTALWLALQKHRRIKLKLTDYTPIHPDFIARMKSAVRAKNTGWDLSYRPWSDSRRMRIAVLNRSDNGDYSAAANVAGLEIRDPTADRRLIEFCLSVPDSQYLRDGQDRWLLRRLMGKVLPPEILEARTGGLQAADWYEAAGRSLPKLREEIADLMTSNSVGGYLDLAALKEAAIHWPETGWDTPEVALTYRLKLLRGLSAGLFIRYIDDSNLS